MLQTESTVVHARGALSPQNTQVVMGAITYALLRENCSGVKHAGSEQVQLPGKMKYFVENR